MGETLFKKIISATIIKKINLNHICCETKKNYNVNKSQPLNN